MEQHILPNLLKTLLGSEPAIRLRAMEATDEDRAELIEALNAGAKQSLFNFRFTGGKFTIFQPGGDFNHPPLPTVEYDLFKYTIKRL